VIRRNNSSTCKIEWRRTAYHTVLQILGHPVYAGAYVFGRTTQRTRIVDGRHRKPTGHTKPMTGWNVLLRDHHPGYISWERYEANQKLISENAHMLAGCVPSALRPSIVTISCPCASAKVVRQERTAWPSRWT